jgi:hypothetical protein
MFSNILATCTYSRTGTEVVSLILTKPSMPLPPQPPERLPEEHLIALLRRASKRKDDSHIVQRNEGRA